MRGIVAALVPCPQETLFLRACLDAGPGGASAWQAWRQGHNLRAELEQNGTPYKRLLALLAFTLEQNGAVLEPGDTVVLRAARLREGIRSQAYREILCSVLAGLNAAGVNPLVLRGAVLSDTVYPAPGLRHNHDIDLLVHPADLNRALACLEAQGLRREQPPRDPACTDHVRVHASGLPVAVHDQLSPAFSQAVTSEIWARAIETRWGDVTARTPAREDVLVQLLAHTGASTARAMNSWVGDAFFIIQRTPNLDWGYVLETAGRIRAELPLAVLLGYLRGELHAPVPAPTLNELERAASRATRSDYARLLTDLRASGGGGYRASWRRAAGWRERAIVAEWFLGSIFANLFYQSYNRGADRSARLPAALG